MPGQGNGPSAVVKRKLVLDTGALVAGTDSLFCLRGLVNHDGSALSPLEGNEQPEFHLVPEVAQEVKDPRARARLQLIRDGAVVRAPTLEALDAVVRFAKATGDYPALSRVDLRVLALAWMVERETNGTRFLRAQPPEPIFSRPETVSIQEVIAEEEAQAEAEERERQRELTENEGWVPVVRAKAHPASSKPKPKKSKKKKKVSGIAGPPEPSDTPSLPYVPRVAVASHDSSPDFKSGRNESETARSCSIDAYAGSSDPNLTPLESLADSVEDVHIDGDGEFSDDGVGWINPDNLEEHVAKDLGGGDAVPEESQCTGCVTTDFAMQNVLLQMGINLISVDGRRVIRRVRRYVLRCHSCTEVTREVDRLFCGRCGNASLTRVTYDIGEDGVARLYLSSRFRHRLRGTKYPLPMPRGGRNNNDLILCEDQIDFQKLRRAEKQRERNAVDVLDPDTAYKVGAKFRPHKPLVVGYGSRNPNEGKPSTKVSRR